MSIEWKLPDPPAGQQWHREDFTEAMLPPGTRPLLKGEIICEGDELCAPSQPNWHPVSGSRGKTTEYFDQLMFRTTRPLPPSAEAQPESAGEAAFMRYMNSRVGWKHDGPEVDKLRWECTAQAAIAWHLAQQPKPPSPEKRENPLEARGIHLSSSKPEGKTEWPTPRELRKEWLNSAEPSAFKHCCDRLISLANAKIEQAKDDGCVVMDMLTEEQNRNLELVKQLGRIREQVILTGFTEDEGSELGMVASICDLAKAAVKERDTALEKVKEAEQERDALNERLEDVVEAAEQAGWNGVENSKILGQFIIDTSKELASVTNHRRLLLDAQSDLKAELSRLTSAAAQQAQGDASTREAFEKAMRSNGHFELPEAWWEKAGVYKVPKYQCMWNAWRAALVWMQQAPPASPPVRETEKQHPCDECGKPRTKAEGGTTFTVCDECWDKLHNRTSPPPAPEAEKWAKEKAAHKAGRMIQCRTRWSIEHDWTGWIYCDPKWEDSPLFEFRIAPDDSAPAVPEEEKPRRFRRIGGFSRWRSPNFACLECRNNEVFFVYEGGAQSKSRYYTLADCEKFVAEGKWEELPTPEPFVPQKEAPDVILTPEEKQQLRENAAASNLSVRDYLRALAANKIMQEQTAPPSEGPAAAEKCPTCGSVKREVIGVSRDFCRCNDPWHSSPPTEPKAWVPKFKVGDWVRHKTRGTVERIAWIASERLYRLRFWHTDNVAEAALELITPIPESGAVPSDLLARIASYFGNGGLFNPEMMEHDKVRDLLMDCRDCLASLKPAGEGETPPAYKMLFDGMEKALDAAGVPFDTAGGHPLNLVQRIECLRSRLEQAEKDRDDAQRIGTSNMTGLLEARHKISDMMAEANLVQAKLVAADERREKAQRDEAIVRQDLTNLRASHEALGRELEQAKTDSQQMVAAKEAFERIRKMVGATEHDYMPAEHYVSLKLQELSAALKRAQEERGQTEQIRREFVEMVHAKLTAAGVPTHHPDTGAPARKPMMPQERIDWLCAARAQHRFIPTSERLPTREEANRHGVVLTIAEQGGVPRFIHWNEVDQRSDAFWMTPPEIHAPPLPTIDLSAQPPPRREDSTNPTHCVCEKNPFEALTKAIESHAGAALLERCRKMEEALRLILDCADYSNPAGRNCLPNDMVGAVLPIEILEKGRQALASPSVEAINPKKP